MLRRILVSLVAKLAEGFVVLAVLATLLFFSMRLLPGDPAVLVLGDQARPEEIARLRHQLHLDEPLLVQYARFWNGLVHLDLGDSLRRPGVRAMTRVAENLAPTSALAALSVFIGSIFGTSLAVLGVGPWFGKKRAWIDRSVNVISAVPLLSFAPVLTLVLAAHLRLVPLPGDPQSGFAGLLFASSLLALPLSMQVARVGRAALEDVARGQFLLVAKAKGAKGWRIWWLHAVPAAIGPFVTVIAAQLGALLGGAVVLERLFERAGLGSLILDAYASRDLPVLQAAVLAAAALFVFAQSAATLVHALIDPRVNR